MWNILALQQESRLPHFLSNIIFLFKRDVWIVSKVLISNLDAMRFRQCQSSQISTPLINLANLIVFWASGISRPKDPASEKAIVKEYDVKWRCNLMISSPEQPAFKNIITGTVLWAEKVIYLFLSQVLCIKWKKKTKTKTTEERGRRREVGRCGILRSGTGIQNGNVVFSIKRNPHRRGLMPFLYQNLQRRDV